jgi:hypothetical protein
MPFQCTANSAHLYEESTPDGFCPQCPGVGLLLPQETRTSKFPTVINLGILLCDASASMSHRAFPSSPITRVSLAATAAANGIALLFEKPKAKRKQIYVAIAAFAAKAAPIKDPAGKPFLKSIDEIKTEFRTVEKLQNFLAVALAAKADSLDHSHTNITNALALGHATWSDALNGSLAIWGVPNRISLEVKTIHTKDASNQKEIPNCRVLLFTDGSHNPTDHSPLINPFADKANSVLMTCYMGPDNSENEKVKNLACICPQHEMIGHFQIKKPHNYPDFVKLFSSSSAASGFCPSCAGINTAVETDSAPPRSAREPAQEAG